MRYKKKRPGPSQTPSARKLSDILIEIAMLGFKASFRQMDPHPPAGHILMWLAAQAWNREVYADPEHPSFSSPAPIAQTMARDLGVSQADLDQQFISRDWETLIEMMRIYKRKHFPRDRREILACGYTPQGTLRVLWE